MKRRQFIYSIPLITALSSYASTRSSLFQRFKISLNAYSFNNELKAHKINLFELLNFCKTTGFDAIGLIVTLGGPCTGLIFEVLTPPVWYFLTVFFISHSANFLTSYTYQKSNNPIAYANLSAAIVAVSLL